MGLERNLLSPYNLQSIVSKRLNARLPFMLVKAPGTAPGAAPSGAAGRFNSTQALKRFCREQYKEVSQRNPNAVSKPPKNSASKAEFVTWATQNNIDISHFRTRAYRRREACVMS
jgi:beta-galactosidase GanA